ncbi:hypothetical protein DRO54_06820 [Candidatus Bathyarchaeota archaeon]|nr:MAG: hypothetical protein DRO54_06820 [Candidatus Bathyarchaeota archaeon]
MAKRGRKKIRLPVKYISILRSEGLSWRAIQIVLKYERGIDVSVSTIIRRVKEAQERTAKAREAKLIKRQLTKG